MAVVEQIFPALTWRIRQLAMYPEQQILDMELPDDFEGVHFGLYHQYELTAVVSLFDDNGLAQFRKMAVLPTDQGRGFGQQLLQYLITYCQTQNIKTLWCNARLSAVGFYEKNGFVTVGEPFLRNHITYVKMEMLIS